MHVKAAFFAGARCQLLVVKTVSTMCANLVLKQWDAVLTKVKDSISLESFMGPVLKFRLGLQKCIEIIENFIESCCYPLDSSPNC